TSRSICSNASSTRFSTCFLSLCRCFSFPRCFIQGFSWVVVFNFSWIASVTSWRRGIPRWAAADFARRNKKSGISRVVFTHPILPYLWEALRRCPLPAEHGNRDPSQKTAQDFGRRLPRAKDARSRLLTASTTDLEAGSITHSARRTLPCWLRWWLSCGRKNRCRGGSAGFACRGRR